MTIIHVSKKARKQLEKAPQIVKLNFNDWYSRVLQDGLIETRKIKGYHDEPLQGKRKGERSIRLNKQWRAIYIEINGIIEVEISEVTPHDY
ncbi:MAG: hypothetical protein ACK5T0_06985 [Vampirovibrionales bacterium]